MLCWKELQVPWSPWLSPRLLLGWTGTKPPHPPLPRWGRDSLLSNITRAKFASRELPLLEAIPQSQKAEQSYKPHFHRGPGQEVPAPPLTPLPASVLVSAGLGTGVCQDPSQTERVLLGCKIKKRRQKSHIPGGSISIQVPREAHSRDSKKAVPGSC